MIPPLTLHAIEPTTSGLSAVTNMLDGLGIASLQSVRLVFSSLTPMKTWAPLNVEVRQIHVRQIHDRIVSLHIYAYIYVYLYNICKYIYICTYVLIYMYIHMCTYIAP